MLFHNKDDIQFVTEFPWFFGTPFLNQCNEYIPDNDLIIEKLSWLDFYRKFMKLEIMWMNMKKHNINTFNIILIYLNKKNLNYIINICNMYEYLCMWINLCNNIIVWWSHQTVNLKIISKLFCKGFKFVLCCCGTVTSTDSRYSRTTAAGQNYR